MADEGVDSRAAASSTETYNRKETEPKLPRVKKVESDKSVLGRLFGNKTEKRRSFTNLFSRRKGRGDTGDILDPSADAKQEEPQLQAAPYVLVEDKCVGPSETELHLDPEKVSLQLDNLHAKLNDRSLQVERLLKSNKDLSNRIMDKEGKYRESVKLLEEKENAIKELGEKLKDNENNRTEMKMMNENMEKTLALQKTEMEKLNANAEEKETLKKNIADLKLKYESVLDQCEKAELDVAYLTEDKDDLNKQMNQLRNDYLFLQGKYQKLSADNLRYKNNYITIKHRANESINDCLDELNTVIDDNRFLMQKNFKNYPKEFQKVLKVSDDYLKMRSERNVLAAQVEKLTTKIVVQEVLIGDLETELFSAMDTLRRHGIDWTVHIDTEVDTCQTDAKAETQKDSSSDDSTCQAASSSSKHKVFNRRSEPIMGDSHSSKKDSEQHPAKAHSFTSEGPLHSRYNFKSTSKMLFEARESD